MGTTIWDNFGIHVKRSYGGRDVGTVYYITIGDRYVCLTGQEFKMFLDGCKANAQARP